ncbi:MAG: hypothetical protein WAV05_08750 [Anaerolineales bacterium]
MQEINWKIERNRHHRKLQEACACKVIKGFTPTPEPGLKYLETERDIPENIVETTLTKFGVLP